MNPTLETGDLLHLAQYGTAAIREGDVIVFKPEGKTNAVTHRVMCIDGNCVRTQGDNNDQADPWVVTGDMVLGRVVSATTAGRCRSVHGGVRGRIQGRVVRLRRSVRQRLFRLIQPSYRHVAAWGLFRWIARIVETRIVSFSRPGMPRELHLHMAGRVIGRLLPGEERWRIKPPFRLIVDEGSLPGNESKALAMKSASDEKIPFSE